MRRNQIWFGLAGVMIGLLVVVAFHVGLSGATSALTLLPPQGVRSEGPTHIAHVWANEGGDKVWRSELRATDDPNAVLNSAWDGAGISLFGARNEVVALNSWSTDPDVWEAARAELADIIEGALACPDLDGSGGVDIADIMLVAALWHTAVGDPGYDPTYDLDSNGRIDIVDIMLVAVHWGENCTEPTPTPPEVAGCPVFPADNIWNVRVDTLPLDPNSAAYVATIGATAHLHPDFGSGTWEGEPIGIPYVDVPGTQPLVDVTFEYADESDPGPYPIPPDPPIEGGPDSEGDRHVLIVDRDHCILYELYDAWPQPDGSWYAGSGAIFDLNSHALRPAGWTSADAAGLPILPGLVRYDEVDSGEIRHAIRVTAPKTRREYIWPARHYASYLTGSQYPPMGQRFRLKADFDISGFSPEAQVILQALKTYGMMLADNGAAWFISGVPDERWDNDVLVPELHQVKGSDFEAVDVSSLMVDPDSGQAGGG